MGEHICNYCGYMNGHLYVHEHLKCESCNKSLKDHICDSCNVPFEEPSKEFLNYMRALENGSIRI